MDKKKLISLSLMLAAFGLSLLFLIAIKYFALSLSSLHVSLTLGFLLILGLCAGKIFAVFSLPQLSGFLFVGMLCGPSFLAIIGAPEIKELAPLNELALTLIAVQAGAEISIKFLRSGIRSISLVIVWQSAVIFIGMTGVFLLAVFYLGLDIAQSNTAAVAAAILFATLSISKAPADTLAILGETKLKGDFANHVLGVVVLIDILVIVWFQVVLLFIKPYVIPGAFFDSQKIVFLLEELLSSLAAGFSVGLIFIIWFGLKRISMRQNVLFLILASFGIGAMCHYLRYDGLIVFIVGGFIVSNMSQKGHSLVETVEALSTGVMIVFFATAGAMLDLQVLKVLWPYALLLAFSRIFFAALGTYFGHWSANDPLDRYRYSFSGYISQAGVTLVLAQLAARSLGELGLGIASLATAVVAINEMIGPVAFKLAIKREQAGKWLINNEDQKISENPQQ